MLLSTGPVRLALNTTSPTPWKSTLAFVLSDAVPSGRSFRISFVLEPRTLPAERPEASVARPATSSENALCEPSSRKSWNFVPCVPFVVR